MKATTEEMIKLYEVEKMTLRAIALKFGITHQAVYDRLKNANYRAREDSKGKAKKNKFVEFQGLKYYESKGQKKRRKRKENASLRRKGERGNSERGNNSEERNTEEWTNQNL